MEQNPELDLLRQENAELKRENQELRRENQELKDKIVLLETKISELTATVESLKQLLFGKKSEKVLVAAPKAAVEAEKVKAKSTKQPLFGDIGESGLRFIEGIEIIECHVPNPATAGLREDQYEILGDEIFDRIAQRRSAYYVKRYIRPKIKILETSEIKSAPAILDPLGTKLADVSLFAGAVVDKFQYHLPLYRQHARLKNHGVHISRGIFNTWISSFIGLFEPIYDAILKEVLSSSVISMDETPHKVGVSNNKMKQEYFWFIYGASEICVFHTATRGAEIPKKMLSEHNFQGTLLSDGWSAYGQIVKELQLMHAQCWAHARREFIEAQGQEPEKCAVIIKQIAEIYALEGKAPEDPEELLHYRLEQIKPRVEELFVVMEQYFEAIKDLPKNSFTKALRYSLNRTAELSVFLHNPFVPIDNNHTERSVKNVVMGRKNYLFCWNELGAKNVAIAQTIILSCQLQGVDPFDYLEDVSDRISHTPSTKVMELIPKNWKVLHCPKNQQKKTDSS